MRMQNTYLQKMTECFLEVDSWKGMCVRQHQAIFDCHAHLKGIKKSLEGWLSKYSWFQNNGSFSWNYGVLIRITFVWSKNREILGWLYDLLLFINRHATNVISSGIWPVQPEPDKNKSCSLSNFRDSFPLLEQRCPTLGSCLIYVCVSPSRAVIGHRPGACSVPKDSFY